MFGLIGGALAPYFTRILAFGAIALAVIGLLFGVRQSGKEAARVEGLRDQLDNVKKRNEIDDEVRRADPGDKRKRLYGEWSRD